MSRSAIKYTGGMQGHSVFIDVPFGSDISHWWNREGIKHIANDGGHLELPAGHYTASQPLVLNHGTNTIQRVHVHGPTQITYTGPDEVDAACIDAGACYECLFDGLHIRGEHGRNFQKAIGIRVHGGLNNRQHGGKGNILTDCTVENMGVGIHVGGILGPDMVNTMLIGCSVNHCRVGAVVQGQNVATTTFLVFRMANCEESGFKLIGHTARQIRESIDDEQKYPNVLSHWDGTEVFLADLPEHVIGNPAHMQQDADGVWVTWGGALNVVVDTMTSQINYVEAWLFDLHNAVLRVAGQVRDESQCGLIRTRGPFGPGVMSSVIEDLESVSFGGASGQVVRKQDRIDMSLLRGCYNGAIARGADSNLVVDSIRSLDLHNAGWSCSKTTTDPSTFGPHITDTGVEQSSGPYGRTPIKVLEIYQPEYAGELVDLEGDS